MKNVLITLILVFSFTVSKASIKEITVEVVFENNSEIGFKYGILFISDTQESFEIILPKRSIYQFNLLLKSFQFI